MKKRQHRVKMIEKLYQNDLLSTLENKEKLEKDNCFFEVLTKLQEIDYVISNTLTGYTIERLSFLDRAIIRYATYEMLYTEVPKAVIINEAIEITKTYSDIDDKQKAFTNRLLDNIRKSIKE